MKELNNIIKMYEYNMFYIYIIEDKDSYSYYLQYKDYGVIRHIYGIPKEKGINELKKLIYKTLIDDCVNLLEDFDLIEEL